MGKLIRTLNHMNGLGMETGRPRTGMSAPDPALRRGLCPAMDPGTVPLPAEGAIGGGVHLGVSIRECRLFRQFRDPLTWGVSSDRAVYREARRGNEVDSRSGQFSFRMSDGAEVHGKVCRFLVRPEVSGSTDHPVRKDVSA